MNQHREHPLPNRPRVVCANCEFLPDVAAFAEVDGVGDVKVGFHGEGGMGGDVVGAFGDAMEDAVEGVGGGGEEGVRGGFRCYSAMVLVRSGEVGWGWGGGRTEFTLWNEDTFAHPYGSSVPYPTVFATPRPVRVFIAPYRLYGPAPALRPYPPVLPAPLPRPYNSPFSTPLRVDVVLLTHISYLHLGS